MNESRRTFIKQGLALTFLSLLGFGPGKVESTQALDSDIDWLAVELWEQWKSFYKQDKLVLQTKERTLIGVTPKKLEAGWSFVVMNTIYKVEVAEQRRINGQMLCLVTASPVEKK